MKKLGCLILILGIVLFGLSSVFIAGIMSSYEGQLLTSLPLKASARATSELISAPRDLHYEVRFTVLHKSKEEHPHFRFPVSYRIVDEKGTTIFSEAVVADPDGARPWGMNSVSRRSSLESVSAHAEFTFGHFAMNAPGTIRLEAELKPDSQTREEPIEPKLRIYYQVPQGPPNQAWFILSLGGLALMVIGVAIFIASFFLRKRPLTVPHK